MVKKSVLIIILILIFSIIIFNDNALSFTEDRYFGVAGDYMFFESSEREEFGFPGLKIHSIPIDRNEIFYQQLTLSLKENFDQDMNLEEGFMGSASVGMQLGRLFDYDDSVDDGYELAAQIFLNNLFVEVKGVYGALLETEETGVQTKHFYGIAPSYGARILYEPVYLELGYSYLMRSEFDNALLMNLSAGISF